LNYFQEQIFEEFLDYFQSKEDFKFFFFREVIIMAVVRTHFENNNEVGVFSKLTNAYCLIGWEVG